MLSRKGFTLIELLVVIGIIGILIAALVPVVKGAQIKAKEAAVKTQLASIETALSAYAQNHSGNYPGAALDVMAPYTDHALGDNQSVPPLYTGGASNAFDVAPGRMVQGVLGGFGHYNPSTTNVFEQLRQVKNLPATPANANRRRFFDSLIASDAIQDYPKNPFISTGANQRAAMRNIFWFELDLTNGFNPNNNFSPGVSDPNTALYNCAIYVSGGGTGGTAVTDTFDTTRKFLRQNPLPGGVPLAPGWSPESFAQQSVFGTDENDYFAPGDFAYVPVLSSSASPFGDSTATVENERFKWGVNVTGYLLFGYGQKAHKSRDLEDEERDFQLNGLPGYGNAGVDTIYENYVLQLFEGAIYFSKKL